MENIPNNIITIKNKIYTIRGMQVMLDKDLAEPYGVKPIRLREQVKRNIKRFPKDFMFQLSDEELNTMVSQNATPSKKQFGGALPYVFSENGISMLSSVLKNKQAIEINIAIIRTFKKLREFSKHYNALAKKIMEVERKSDISELEKILPVILILSGIIPRPSGRNLVL